MQNSSAHGVQSYLSRYSNLSSRDVYTNLTCIYIRKKMTSPQEPLMLQ
jgi:hypothetical protein